MKEYCGGLRIGESFYGAVNYSYPLVLLEFDKSSLHLKSPISEYVLHIHDIVSIRLYRGFFSSGIKIEHQVKSIPVFLVFWTMWNRNEIIKRLEELQYPVFKVDEVKKPI